MSVFGSLITLLVSRIIGSVLQFVTILILARQGDVTQFGEYATTVALGAIFGAIAGFGFPTMALRTTSPKLEITRPVMLRLTVLGTTLAGGAVSVVALASGKAPGWWLAAGAMFTMAEMMHTLLQNLLLAAGMQGLAEVSTLLRRGTPLVAAAGALWLNVDVYLAVFVGSLASYALAFAIAGRWTLARSNVRLSEIVRASRPYWGAAVGAMFQQLDVTIVNIVLGPSAAGGYAGAFRIASPVHIVTGALVGLVVPATARDPSSRVTRRYMRIGLGYSLLLLLFSPAMYVVGPLLLGASYQSYAVIFVVLFVNSAVSVLNQLLGGRMMAMGQAKFVSAAIVVSTFSGLLVTLLVAVAWQSLSGVAVSVASIQGTLLVALLAKSRWRSS